MIGFLLTLAITAAFNVAASLLTPKPNVKTRGPRLSDLRVTSSAYGQPIPIIEGSYRVGGNVIWSTGIEEVENTTKTSIGKGGGGTQTDTTFSYFSSFALGLCEGEIDDIARIWADGKIVYDKSGTTVVTKKDGLNFRLYRGTEEQIPDYLVLADKGANAPAFRGIAYIMFDRAPLADFGNRVPNITVEVLSDKDAGHDLSAAGRRPSIAGTPMPTPPNELGGIADDQIAMDWERGYAYVVSETGVQGVRRYETASMTETKQISMSDATGGQDTAVGSAIAVAPDGAVIMGVGAGNSTPIVRLDPVSLVETARFGISDTNTNNSITSFAQPGTIVVNKCGGALGSKAFVGVANLRGTILNPEFGILSLPDMEFVWDGTVTGHDLINEDTTLGMCAGAPGGGSCEFFFMAGSDYSPSPSAVNLKIWKFDVDQHAGYNITFGTDRITTGIVSTLIVDATPDNLIPGETLIRGAGRLVYDSLDGNIMTLVTSDSDGTTYWIKFDSQTGDVLWRTAIASAPQSVGDAAWDSRVNAGRMGWVGVDGTANLIDTRTGELLLDNVAWDAPVASPFRAGAYDGESGSWIGVATSATYGMGRWFFNRLDLGGGVGGVSVGSIVRRLCESVGLAAADIDTTDIDLDIIPGYAVLQQASARSAIEPLGQAYFFDGVESDWVLKFVSRGRASARTITEEDLTVLNESFGEYLVETRKQELDLPVSYGVSFIDVENNYEEGYQASKRIKEPTLAVHSDQKLEFDFTAAITSDFGKQISEKLLYASWQERDMATFNTSWANADLDPTDRVSLVMDSGDLLEPRLTSADMGLNFTIEFNGVSEDASSYSSTATAYAGEGAPAQTIRATFATKLILLDSPLLLDSDEPVSRAYIPTYFFMGGFAGSDWIGGALYKSADTASYTEVGRIASPMAWGTTMTVLGDPVPGNVFGTDEVNSVRVAMSIGADALAGITQLEMLNRGNPAVLVKANGEMEVIQYRDVIQEPDGSFTLSGLLRGRRGTDTMAYDHTIGETFLVLNVFSSAKFSLTSAELNAELYYKPVGSGQSIANADVTPVTSEGRALMPYAVVHIAATLDGSNNIDFVWDRRTRLGGALIDNQGGAPLNEDTEEYEIDFIDPYDGTIARTITGITTNAYQYLAATWASDGMDNNRVFVSIENPGAELGTLEGWTNLVGAVDVIAGGHSGSFTFEGGSADSSAYQDVAMPAAQYPVIDSGGMAFELNWWQEGTWGDESRMDLEFFDASMVSLGTNAGVDDATAGWTAKQNSATMPPGTRFVRMTMVFTEITPVSNNGMIDDIAADLVGPVLLTPETITVRVYQISAQVGRGFFREEYIYVQ